MIGEPAPVSAIAHLIQLAVAPVFLLAGIGSILNVLAHRLARVVDRSRTLEDAYVEADEAGRTQMRTELYLLDRRMAVVNAAISCCTASALFVCVVVAILFVADLADFKFGQPVALLFILAMLLLIAGLILFLWEVRLAMRSLRTHGAVMPHRRS
jgi:hypothetical protein